MRFVGPVVIISTLSLSCAYTAASSIDNDPAALAELQTKADQAQPRDRCFLYAELVSQMTDLPSRIYDGSPIRRTRSLKRGSERNRSKQGRSRTPGLNRSS
jgi:hypothetical protein